MAVKEGQVDIHIYAPAELQNRFKALVFREQMAGDRRSSVNRHAVKALEEYIERQERGSEEKRGKKK